MAWNAELCEEVATRIRAGAPWASFGGALRVSARAKTFDTLCEKLLRETGLGLNQVQDLAGVRVELDCRLDEQTSLAEELAEAFGVSRAVIKDIRADPHSGYRAVHVWLRLPAGRVEIQIRTWGQTVWANTYERLGDLVGRHIRYGVSDADPVVQRVVDRLHIAAEELAELEGGLMHPDSAERLDRLVRSLLELQRKLSGRK